MRERFNNLTNYKCDCCGAPLKRSIQRIDDFVCEYCGAIYRSQDDLPPIRIETYQNPVRVLKTRMEIEHTEVGLIGEDNMAEIARKNILRGISEALDPYLIIESSYDPRCMKHIITGQIRIVEPDYRF